MTKLNLDQQLVPQSIAKIHKDSILQNVFLGEDKLTVSKLKTLKHDLDALLKQLPKSLNDNESLFIDSCENNFIVKFMRPETIGEWKSRLKKLLSLYHFDSFICNLIREKQNFLFDRNNFIKNARQKNKKLVH